MASRNYPFNTVKNSKRAERLRRRKRARATALSICTVIILLLLSFIILMVGSIAERIGTLRPDTPPTTNETPTESPVSTTVSWVTVSWESKKINSGVLVLVNEDHYFEPITTELINIYAYRTKINGSNPYQVAFDTYRMNRNAFLSMEKMLLQFYEISEKNNTMISSAFRTLEDQSDLGSKVSPGYSDHHTGYCISLKSADPSLPLDSWFYESAHKYGFVQRYPAGKESITGVSDYEHCFRYVGIPHATYMYNNNLCLEEYVQLLKESYTGDNHLAITGTDGNQYEIYYVPASNTELTTIKVPKDLPYTISGDNDSGFIVTVNLSDSNA